MVSDNRHLILEHICLDLVWNTQSLCVLDYTFGFFFYFNWIIIKRVRLFKCAGCLLKVGKSLGVIHVHVFVKKN